VNVADCDETITLYRATSGSRPVLGKRTSWSPDPDVADAYTRNRGFGGDTVFVADVCHEYVLDLTRGRTYHPSLYNQQYMVLREALEESDRWPEIQEALGWHREAPDRFDGAYIHNVWENSRMVFGALSALYSWVVFFDDFPEGAVTWTKLDDTPIEARRFTPNGRGTIPRHRGRRVR
jgi:hypothetical protein